jgi:hypothetical protein
MFQGGLSHLGYGKVGLSHRLQVAQRATTQIQRLKTTGFSELCADRIKYQRHHRRNAQLQ